jgi:sulfite dehydrogenase (quinone) subunit SoeC
MHPAPSLIVFTVLSGLGFGLLAMLGLGLRAPLGWVAFGYYAMGYGLAGAGLMASTFHLGHPERALRAFTQWRTSWLSREAVLSAATLALLAPHAAGAVFWATPLPILGAIGGGLALATVAATAMIYGQLKTVPRWNHWTTPAVFVTAALAGGALLAGLTALAGYLLALLALALVAHWQIGDLRFGNGGSTMGTATGLAGLGAVRMLAPPHTGGNYLLKEMVHVVGRRHALKLRLIALACAAVLPAVLLAVAPASYAAVGLAATLHLLGMLAARWLFFAEAEHVVGLYYGGR